VKAPEGAEKEKNDSRKKRGGASWPAGDLGKGGWLAATKGGAKEKKPSLGRCEKRHLLSSTTTTRRRVMPRPAKKQKKKKET